MSDLVLPIKNGQVDDTTSTSTAKAGKTTENSNSLGKDAFLQLLVTQMKYQDPLNPQADTEFVSQLATFSQLEQMQNLNQVSSNSQAFSLVGKTVTVKTEDSSGNSKLVEGVVDYVTMSNGTAYMSINDNLYPISQLNQVMDDTYILLKGLPTVGAYNGQYDAENPKDVQLSITMGSGSTIATDFVVVINGKKVDSSNIEYNDGKLTVKGKAFEELENGKYNVMVAFNDSLGTTVKDKVTITVVNSTYVAPPKEDTDDKDDAGTDNKEEDNKNKTDYNTIA